MANHRGNVDRPDCDDIACRRNADISRAWRIGGMVMDTKDILLVAGFLLLLILIAPGLLKHTASAYAALIQKAQTQYGDYIRSLCNQYGIPPQRVTAMIIQESGVNPGATGGAGERGLMQMTQIALLDVNNNYHQGLLWADMYDPKTNILAGVLYLSLLARRLKGDIDGATQAYNVGIGAYSLDKTKGASYLESVKRIEAEIAYA